MLQQDIPDDYVIATGETHSVGEFAQIAFEIAGIPDGVERYVKIDDEFKRPSEVDLLIGDASKAKKKLNWEPQVSFRELIELMLENDLRIESDTK